jgi:hypothetical protein
MADNDWTEMAYAAVRQVAQRQPEFTPTTYGQLDFRNQVKRAL